MTPQTNPLFPSEKSISDYVSGKFFRCTGAFLSWLKPGEAYWFERLSDGRFEVRSDNNLGKRFSMTEHQLLTCFYPVQCEEDMPALITHFYMLGELGIHSGRLTEMFRSLSARWTYINVNEC